MGGNPNNACGGGSILFLLKNQKSHTDKINFLNDVIAECTKKSSKKNSNSGEARAKRRMSGYNCYMKQCAKKKDFSTCLTEKGWAKLSDNDKEKYNKMALEGCDL